MPCDSICCLLGKSSSPIRGLSLDCSANLGTPARWVEGLLAAWQATCRLCLGERGSLQEARREIAGDLPQLPTNRRGDVAEWLGRAAWTLGERVEALRWYQEALLIVHPDAAKEMVWTWWPSNRPRFVSVLGGLEAACADADEFRAFCRRCEETGIAGPAGLQWCLEPAPGAALESTAPTGARLRGGVCRPIDAWSGWPRVGSGKIRWATAPRSRASGRAGGLILEAANGRDPLLDQLQRAAPGAPGHWRFDRGDDLFHRVR